jgi:hypothetical protein
VGRAVGPNVGEFVSPSFVGIALGELEGSEVGDAEGRLVGTTEGMCVGALEGCTDGGLVSPALVGKLDGAAVVGTLVAPRRVGAAVGSREMLGAIDTVGNNDGTPVGLSVGFCVGWNVVGENDCPGASVGEIEGMGLITSGQTSVEEVWR